MARDKRHHLIDSLWAKEPHCMYCGQLTVLSHDNKPAGKNRATLEHVIPIARGGHTSWANLSIACYGCNNRRGNMRICVFLHVLKLEEEVREKIGTKPLTFRLNFRQVKLRDREPVSDQRLTAEPGEDGHLSTTKKATRKTLVA